MYKHRTFNGYGTCYSKHGFGGDLDYEAVEALERGPSGDTRMTFVQPLFLGVDRLESWW